MTLTKTSQAYQAISEARLGLTEGVVVCIDPSIGSSSSMPGYAVYRAGLLSVSGTLRINPHLSFPEKAQALHHEVRRLYSTWQPDVLCYEEIPNMGPGRQISSHVTLLKAVGIILSVSGPRHFVGIYPRSWKSLARSSYVKSDENDAIEFGWACIQEAKRIIEEEGKKDRKYGQRKAYPTEGGQSKTSAKARP